MPSIDQAILDKIRKLGKPNDALKAYQKERQKRDKQFAQPQPQQPYQALGRFKSIQQDERGAICQMENGYLRVAFLMPDLLQIRIRPDNNFGALVPFSYAVDETNWAEVEPTIIEDAQTVVIGAGNIACRITKETGQFELFARDGKRLINNQDDGFSLAGKAIRWTRELAEDEWCYGLGERATGLNLRGGEYTFWNTDPTCYQRGDDPINFSIPFYLGYQSSHAIGIFWDNPARGKADLGKSHKNKMILEAEAGEFRFYIMSAPTADVVLDRYTTLTGRPFMPPIWTLGYQQSRYSYDSSAKMRTIAQGFRHRGIPCDVLYFDIDYMDGYRIFSWDQKAFPDMPELIKELKGNGFKTVCILDPGLKTDEKHPPFPDGKQKDVFVKYPDGSLFEAPVWADTSVFPDFTKPTGREWWASQVQQFIQKAPFDGIWNDMNECVIFTPDGPGEFPDYMPYDYEGQGSTEVEGGHNVYGTQMARATRMGLEKAYPDKRPFTMTRAGYAGAQRYTASWTGDNLSTWDHLKLSISMVMNLGLSGFPFTGPDVGGFGGDTDGELFTRWIQVGCMMPYFRTHTLIDTVDQEPWSFGAEYEAIIKSYIELRYKLLPYFYSVMAIAHQKGMPFMRPGFFADPNDPHLRAQDDAFLIGDSLFVAPIVEKGAVQRVVYLPRGAWYDFWTNQLIDGSRYISVTAPLNRLPMFVKSGHSLPMWQVQQYVGEKQLDEITIRIYAGPGETTFYEDAGEGLGYQQGNYRFSYLTAGFFPGGQFGIDWRTAGNYKPTYDKIRVEMVGIPGEPQDITIDRKPAPLWFYENGSVEIVTPPFKELRMSGRRPDGSAAAQTVLRRPPGLG